MRRALACAALIILSAPGAVSAACPPAGTLSAMTLEDVSLSQPLSLAQADADGALLAQVQSFLIISHPPQSVASVSGPKAQSLLYRPAPNACSLGSPPVPDVLVFDTLCADGTRGSDEGGVMGALTVLVGCVDDAPVAQDQSLGLDEDTELSVILSATDADAHASLSYAIETPPASGELLGVAPMLIYKPDPHFHGIDSFTFAVRDDNDTDPAVAALPVIGTITLSVRPLNDPPEAQGAVVNTGPGERVTITLVATDVDGDALDYTVAQEPTPGTFTGQGATWSYTPPPMFAGSVQLLFTARERATPERYTSAVGTVTIHVADVNDPPTFIAPTPEPDTAFTVAEGTPFSLRLAGLDPDDDMLTFALAGAPASATFDPQTRLLSMTPTWRDIGAHTLIASVKDGGAPVTRRFTLEVTLVDEDGDGLALTLEQELGLNPSSPDSDADTISDGVEVGPDWDNPRDTDEDGIIDALDLDSDGDGVPDLDEAGDALLHTPPVDSDFDNIPDYRERDSDHDGVEELLDNCPRGFNPNQEDMDGDGVGDVCDDDLDGDGVLNSVDLCPDRFAESANGCDQRTRAQRDEGCAAGGVSQPSVALGWLALLALGALRRRRSALTPR